MALIFLDQTKCSICGGIIKENYETIGFPFINNQKPVFKKHIDTGMHLQCFREWELLPILVKEYNKYFQIHYRGMRKMLDNGDIVEVEGYENNVK